MRCDLRVARSVRSEEHEQWKSISSPLSIVIEQYNDTRAKKGIAWGIVDVVSSALSRDHARDNTQQPLTIQYFQLYDS